MPHCAAAPALAQRCRRLTSAPSSACNSRSRARTWPRCASSRAFTALQSACGWSCTASLPILLIALGAFGGVLAFGFIGLFLGPTFLALGQALFAAWTAITPAADEADSTEGLA